jgi:tetratricopeptide (TPR) repeat protein
VSNANELLQAGVQLFQNRDYEAAAERFTAAQAAFQADRKEDMAAEMLVNLGLMQQALAVFQTMRDDKRIAQVLGNLGGVLAAQGDKEQAATCYRQAADTFKALGEEALYGQTLLALGDLQVRSGQVMAGASTYEIGLENLDELSGPQKLLKGLLGIKNRLTGSAPAGGGGGAAGFGGTGDSLPHQRKNNRRAGLARLYCLQMPEELFLLGFLLRRVDDALLQVGRNRLVVVKRHLVDAAPSGHRAQVIPIALHLGQRHLEDHDALAAT